MTRRLHNTQDVYNTIVELVGRHGIPPTFREIAAEAGIPSLDTVHRHVHILVDMSLVSHWPTFPRSLRVLEPWPTEAEEGTV